MARRVVVLWVLIGMSACGGSGGPSADVARAPDASDVARPDSGAAHDGVTDDVGPGSDSADGGPGADVPAYEQPPPEDLVRYVNTLVGTSGAGNTLPGPMLPHGMVKLSPDSFFGGPNLDSYEYGQPKIEGFSHTHLSGPGGPPYGYSDFLVTAGRGEVVTSEREYASEFSHETEVATAGYYAVDLTTPDARAELTATAHCGVHRYTFRGETPGWVVIDAGHTRGRSDAGAIEVVGDRVVSGWHRLTAFPLHAAGISGDDGRTGVRRLWFYAEVSRPFDTFGTWDADGPVAGRTSVRGPGTGAWAAFDDPTAPVEVRLCVSAIDAEQAAAHFASEVEGRAFEDVRQAASDAWNEVLNRVRVEGGTEEQRAIFYTALYHAFGQPSDMTEGDRFWSGFDGVGAVFSADDWHYYADDWCLWDTFRTTHPLGKLVEPERASDIVRSLLHAYRQGGWLPKCPWHATGYSRVMIARPSNPVIVDAIAKGFDDFDLEEAYEAMVAGAVADVPNPAAGGGCGYMNLGTVPDYLELGYVAHECDALQSASMTLEYAHDDWCLAELAARLGRVDDEAVYRARAGSWRNHWNPEAGFMQGRLRDGSWAEPFDPTALADFCETNSWIYTWSVPHDIPGLIEAMGGRAAFVAKLDRYFDEGHHDASNEPGFHAPYLYALAGVPARTADRMRAILASSFRNDPGGLPGNDDAGATSAYYVFGAMGFYPVNPGSTEYVLGSPLFEAVTLYLDRRYYGSASFRIEARGTSETNRYVQTARLNGTPLERPWLSHGELSAGGTLVLEMGPAPSTLWTE